MASPFAIGDLSYHHSVFPEGSAAVGFSEQHREPRDDDVDPSRLVP
jgi:hypothetical protein